MKTAIISPHTDDALFSLGSLLPTLGQVTIISPFAGIPSDEHGKKKHTMLRQEHRNACIMAGVNYINGNFFDDVYGQQDAGQVTEWLRKQCLNFQKIYIPLGIHHPDHIFIRDIFVNNLDFNGFYEELPYRILYPKLASEMAQKFTTGMRRKSCAHRAEKEKSVKMYKSQLAPHLYPQLFVEEFLWSKE